MRRLHGWIQGLLWGSCLVVPVAALNQGNACAPAPPRNTPVEIAQETALIVWDEATQMQHFIRRAEFATSAEDFGFLVPTPTQPELVEVENKVFDTLTEITAPKIIERKMPENSGGGCLACSAAGDKSVASGAAPEAKVEVLESKQVAGYDASVLKPDNADVLAKWLDENGYYFSPELKRWVEPYVAQGWIITAFKIAKNDKQEQSVGSSTVRMSFKTDRPLFPYREPQPLEEEQTPVEAPKPDAQPAEQTDAEQPRPEVPIPAQPQQRLLRVFFLGKDKVKGTLGETEPFPGENVWANKLPKERLETLFSQTKLPAELLPADAWLTEFEDHSSPRPGTDDVFFAKADNQLTEEREPHIRYISRNRPVDGPGLGTYVLATCLVSLVFARTLGRR